MVLFSRAITRFSGNEFGSFNSYPNESLLIGVSFVIGTLVWVQLTKFFFDNNE